MLDTIEEIRTFSTELKEALNSLTEGVSGNAKDVVAQLLSQYSVKIPEVDERLAKCVALLERGLRDEAISYANDSPNLLEMVGFLDLTSQQNWEQWQATLAMHEIPIPVGPNVEAARELNEAEMYLAEIKPLLSKYRRAVLASAPLPQRLSLLRQLREADPTSLAWIESIQDHEKQRLMEIESEARTALHSKDEGALRAMVKELKADWIEEPPSRLYKAVKTSLLQVAGNRVGNQLSIVADALATAKSESDLEAARSLRSQWSTLEAEKGSFSTNDPNLIKALPVLDWVQKHDDIERLYIDLANEADAPPASRKKQIAWVDSLKRNLFQIDGLATDLDAEIDRADINRLISHVNEVIAKHDADEIQSRRWMYLGFAALCVTVITTAWLFISARQYAEAVDVAVQDLRRVLDEVESGEKTDPPVLEDIVSDAVVDDDRVVSIFRKITQAFATEEDRRKRLAAAVGQFDDAFGSIDKSHLDIRAWPEELETASGILVTTLSSLSKADNEITNRIYKQGVLDRMIKALQGQADVYYGEKLESLKDRLKQAERNVRESPNVAVDVVAGVKKDIELVEQEAMQFAMPNAAGDYANHRLVSTGDKEEFALTLKQVKFELASLEKRVKEIKGIRLADDSINAALGNWGKYASLLRSTASTFEDEAGEYAEAATLEPMWKAVDQWNQLAKKCTSIARLKSTEVQDILQQIKVLQENTESDFSKLECVKEFSELNKPLLEALAARNLVELLKELKEWLDREWMSEVGYTVTLGRKTYYLLEDPKGKDLKVITGLKDGAGWPLKPLFGGAQFEVKPSPQAVLADELRTKELLKLPNNAPGLEADQLMIDCIKRVLDAKDVEPCLRVVTVRKFFRLANGGDGSFQSVCFNIPAANDFYPLIDDGAGIPNITKEDLDAAFSPDREDKSAYRAAKQRAIGILVKAQTTLDAIQKDLNQVKLDCEQGPQEIALLGRLVLDDQGRKRLTAKRTVPKTGSIIAVNNTGQFVPVGRIIDSVPLLNSQVPMPAGTPCYVRIEQGNK
jgi:hypothetical protein